jgi:hypothetical protein
MDAVLVAAGKIEAMGHSESDESEMRHYAPTF